LHSVADLKLVLLKRGTSWRREINLSVLKEDDVRRELMEGKVLCNINVVLLVSGKRSNL